jgi:hypothetical protein
VRPARGRDRPGRRAGYTFLRRAAGQRFYNTSRSTLRAIANDPAHAAGCLTEYVGAFSPNAREVLETYDLPRQIKRLDGSNLLYQRGCVRVSASSLDLF